MPNIPRTMMMEKKKLMVAAILTMVLVGTVSPHLASAQEATSTTITISGAINAIEATWSCFTQPFSCTTKAITLIINGFLALLIALVAGLMRIVLQFNDNVVNMPAVQAGFGVTLAIANLGFVLAIIAIALATILRSQTYGIKQLLWKLVVAAIVVNFSLVIAGAILGFSSSLTRYFVQAVPFHQSGTTWTSATGDYLSFVNNITQAFGPQGAYGPPSLQKIAQDCGVGGPGGTWKGYLCNIGAVSGTGLTSAYLNQWLPGGFFSQIIASLMSVIFLLMIFFTFLAITVMLLVRFIYIAILLILAPLVWLLWIFPNTKSNFSKWWSHFIKWTFFPPIVIFFLYLAILTGSRTNQAYLDNNSLPPAGTNPNDVPELAVVMSLKDAIGFNLIPQIEQGIILIGFAVGGLFAANYLSIVGAGVAMGLAKSAGGAVKGYAFTKGKGIVGERVRTAGMRYDAGTRQTTTALQRLGSRLQGIPLVGGIGSVIAKQGAIGSEASLKAIETFRKGTLESLDNNGLLARATARTAFLDPVEAAAVGQEIARRNMLDNPLYEPQLTPLMPRFVQTAERAGNVQDVLSNRPELSQYTQSAQPRFNAHTGVMETPDEARIRAHTEAMRKIKTSNAEQIHHGSLGDYTSAAAVPNDQQLLTALNLTPGQLSRINSEGDQRQIDAIRNTIAYAYGGVPLPPHLAHLAPNADRIREYINNSPNWQNIP